MNLFERFFLESVFKALRSQVKEFTSDVRRSGLEVATGRLSNIITNEKIIPALQNLYVKVGSYFADKTLADLNAQARKEQKGFGLNIDWVTEILRYFNTILLSKAVVPITQKTIEQIRNVISQGQKEGWGVDRIVRELNSSELLMWRARMIVRTETNKAMFYGQKLGESKSEFESVKMWIAAKDHRTRHSHRNVDGKIVDTMGKFSVPVYKDLGQADLQIGVDLMEGPGDPNAHAGNVINCRCTMVRRLKKENGKFIQKRFQISA